MRNRFQFHATGQPGWMRGEGRRAGNCRCGLHRARGGSAQTEQPATAQDQAAFLRTMASELESQLEWIRQELARLTEASL